MPHCPWRLIREHWSPWLATVLDTCHDIESGNRPHGWPEVYTDGFVEAVRYVQRQQTAASARAMEQATAKSKRR